MSEQTEKQVPANFFTTRDGIVISLKPWTAPMLAQNGNAIKELVTCMTGFLLDDGDISALEAVIPALRLSVQSPEMLDKVTGFNDLAGLVQAVLEFNEVGLGLGKFMEIQLSLMQSMGQIPQAAPSL